MPESQKPLRQIRSYVRREGRMTSAQRRALAELWPRFGLASGSSPLDLAASFGRRAPVILEIGFGNGESLRAMAKTHPEHDYVGVEIHRPGVGRLLIDLAADNSQNVRVICEDAREVLMHRIVDESLYATHLFFPDPWPKSRHHKRRLLQADFAELVRRKLVPGGYMHMATDWEDYARHMMEIMTQAPGFENIAGVGQYPRRPEYRPITKFERRGQRLGHAVWDLIFRRAAGQDAGERL
ncbi:MAG: tRNA (guanosine(46)-N7)-methyltransferase TrmB [Acidiferrobacterales bacterium]